MTSLIQLRKRLSSLAAWRPGNRRGRVALALGVGITMAVVATAGVWGVIQAPAPTGVPLTSVVPQGALLTIEAKDFASLLKQWGGSSEKAAWLKSDDYGVFSRSRLFGRLGDAQTEFAQSAGLPPDMSFLSEVAGSESVFAWYDVGKLEFLYITRMPSGSAEKTRLFAMRGKFTRRQIGSQTFYVRSGGGQAGANVEEQEQTGQEQAGREQAQGQEPAAIETGGNSRTVAFATSGDWLLLATREDLMAGALTLLAQSRGAGSGAGNDAAADRKDTVLPVSSEAWFTDARAAAGRGAGDLRMTLNLEKIVRTPYFRSYWIQRNVSEMKQYRSAVTDLDLKASAGAGDAFREERVLLPKSAPEDAGAGADLDSLTALLPQHTGAYRAISEPGVDAAIRSLDEKLLGRGVGAYSDGRSAPVADVAVPDVGSAVDLETRLDAVPLARPAAGVELEALRRTLAGAALQAMMTVSRTGDSAGVSTDLDAPHFFVPFQSAVVLSAAKDWDVAGMQSALRDALAAHVTASGLGLNWAEHKSDSGSYFQISKTRPLVMAVRGKLLILSDDPGLMEEMLTRQRGTATAIKLGAGSSSGGVPMLAAGFDLAEERNALARWTRVVDRNDANGAAADGAGGQPGFFAQDMGSLGDVFSRLASERMVETRDGSLTRQTVTYAWRR